jgi:hypothetical protein
MAFQSPKYGSVKNGCCRFEADRKSKIRQQQALAVVDQVSTVRRHVAYAIFLKSRMYVVAAYSGVRDFVRDFCSKRVRFDIFGRISFLFADGTLPSALGATT